VGCGAKADPAALLRLVAAGGQVALDRERRLGGRGAWLHPDATCLSRALRRGAFPRALRAGGLAADRGELERLLTAVASRD
jgi:predicted RNA-binding protein YlxR (DUF448 family)